MIKKTIFLGLIILLFIAVTGFQALAEVTITVGEYRFVVERAYTQLVDPYDSRVEAEDYQGNQWGIARINEIAKRNSLTGFWDIIWNPGNTVPEPPEGNADNYITAVFGGLTLQFDQRPADLGLPGANNTDLTYNMRIHDSSHPDDYVDSTPGSEQFPHNAYFTSDETIGGAYLKLYSTQEDVFTDDVMLGIGTEGGKFGTFAPNTTAGTLLLDTVLDPLALLAGDLTGDTRSTGADGILGTEDDTLAVLRAQGTSDRETGVLSYFQVTGNGAWDDMFDSNHPNFYGADGQIDFTTYALVGSPYLPYVDGGPDIDPITDYDWDFRDVGQGLVVSPPEIPGICRMTGGGVTENGEILLPVEDSNGDLIEERLAEAIDGMTTVINPQIDRYQFGGQAGAPDADHGEWTHHQQKGPSGSFTFHAGTASAPKDTWVSIIECFDPESCDPARPAPYKQIDFHGVGTFKNEKSNAVDNLAVVTEADAKKKGGEPTLHYFRVHVEDIGEPGGGGLRPECDRTDEDIISKPFVPITENDCDNCSDVYQIAIYASETPDLEGGEEPIYTVGGFIDAGNLQIHPAIE